jgi:hypothetical protein
MADPIPKESGNQARDELQQADSGALPTDAARAQVFGHQVRRERFADRAEYPLIQSVENKQRSDEKAILRYRKAEIGYQENNKRGEQERIPRAACKYFLIAGYAMNVGLLGRRAT